MKRILLKNGLVIQENGQLLPLDLAIEGKRIVGLGPKLAGGQEIDCQGKVLLPGFIDLHVHLREPGFEDKETLASGTRAAARGGVTHVFAMPNTWPSPDSEEHLTLIQEKIGRDALIKVSPVGAITKGLAGTELVDFEALCKGGASGFSDDGHPVVNPLHMAKALEASRKTGLPIMTHSEDLSTFQVGGINRGKISQAYGLDGIPNAAEYNMIKRDIELLKAYGGHLHIAHISARESVELVREAKAQGLSISCEVGPHHFSLTEDWVERVGSLGKVNPPLRHQLDLDAMIEGLKDDTIDCIATDHAPHELHTKGEDLSTASFGISGLETSFTIAYTKLVLPGHLSLARLVDKMSTTPAKLMKLREQGTLAVGKLADIALVDLHKERKIDQDQFVSKGKNTPFHDLVMTGDVVMTISEGKIVYKGEF